MFKLYIEQNKLEHANVIYQQLKEIEKDKHKLQFCQALILRCQGNYVEAAEVLSKLIKKSEQIDDKHLLLNCVIEIENNYCNGFKKENYEPLKKLLQKLNKDPGNLENKCRIYMNLAKLEMANKNYSQALNLYRKVSASPDAKTRELAIIGICKCYFFLGDTKLQDYLEFDELKKYNSSDAVTLLVEIYCLNENYEQASKLLDSVPVDEHIIYYKGNLAMLNKDYMMALKLYKEVFEESNDFVLRAQSLCSIIKIYIELEEYKDAYDFLISNQNLLMAFNQKGYCQMYAVLCKKLNIEYNMGYKTYSASQMLDYDFNKACQHVQKYAEEFKNIDFYGGDIEQFLISLSERLDDKENLLATIFDCYKVGVFTKEGKKVYMKVVVVPGTKDIITCFTYNILNFSEFDIDEEAEIKPKEKVIQRKSQIDKFNERYNKKKD